MIGIVTRLVILSTIAFIAVYIIFLAGMPIGIELPAHILEYREPRPSKQLVKLYKEQVIERQRWLKKLLISREKNNGYMWLYNNLAPEAFCPQLIRLGSTNDGGKWICNPWRIPSDCVILSLGLRNEISFEQQTQELIKSGCKLFGFDKNEPSNVTKQLFREMNGQAEQTTISRSTDEKKNEYTISDIVSSRNISSVEILKIDLEGAEFFTLIPFLEKYTVSQLLIEMHGSADKMLKLLLDLSELNYFLVSHEINGKYHNLCEFSLIHATAFRQYGVKILARYLDIKNRT